MSASAFDPWAMLAKLRGQDQAPAEPISGISGISGEVAAHPEIAREPANDPEAPFEPPPPWCAPGPIVPLYRPGGVVTPDLWLNRLAGNLARVLDEGATPRPCPSGGLDLERPCGRRVSFSAEHVREMRAAGLLIQVV